MNTQTLGTLASEHGVDLLDHLDQEVGVPVLAGLQFQGDVAVIPLSGGSTRGTEVPKAGVAVVRGENGGNTHLLVADGPVLWQAADARVQALALGTATVPEGSTAYLAHPEHGFSGIAPGSYELRRQQEQREVIALVAD